MAKISRTVVVKWLKIGTKKLAKTGGKTMSKILILKDDVPGYVNVADMEVETLGGIPQILYIGEEAYMLHGQYPNAVYYPAKVGTLQPASVAWETPSIVAGHKMRAVK